MGAELDAPRADDGWEPGPADPVLAGGEAQVWRASARSGAADSGAAALLSPPERKRADGFSRRDARARYLTGRVLLRTVLGRLLGRGPTDLRFAYGERGKPRLLAAAGIEFNLTHSGGLAVLAVARRCRVGIDVELVRPRLDVLGVAPLALSPLELDDLAGFADPAERRAAFFRCWTRKEAYLKARADGLPGALREWSVPMYEAASVTPEVPGQAESRRWQIDTLSLGEEYFGAVAHEGELRLRCFDLDG
jgi:4'-phosphopantetheinyl transferase